MRSEQIRHPTVVGVELFLLIQVRIKPAVISDHCGKYKKKEKKPAGRIISDFYTTRSFNFVLKLFGTIYLVNEQKTKTK